jgi:hypothetical protein
MWKYTRVKGHALRDGGGGELPLDAVMYSSRSCEEDPEGKMISAYEAGGKSNTTLVARAWSRRAAGQRMGVRNGRLAISRTRRREGERTDL